MSSNPSSTPGSPSSPSPGSSSGPASDPSSSPSSGPSSGPSSDLPAGQTDGTPDATPPGHDLDDTLVLTTPEQVKAISHPLRTEVLGLLHERAATVTELAAAVERPRSTVAYHVKVLAEAGLLQVVRTRQVRAIEERFYGRTARMFYVGVGQGSDDDGSGDDGSDDELPLDFNDFEVAARESARAFQERKLWGFIRHARISEEQAGEFWARMGDLVREFELLPRSGDTVYGFAIGVYPIDHASLPPEQAGGS